MASMSHVVLGLDIGGANLKAATPNPGGRGVSVPFPLWRQPDRLPAALAELVKQFDDVQEFAVTMTGELCDCFDTKQAGVNAIITAVLNVSRSWPVRFWSTAGKFFNSNEARVHWDAVAAANWHALATFAGQYNPRGTGVLIDVGSTTTDVIPILDGQPCAVGRDDTMRLRVGELVYTGVRRTPLCALLPQGSTCAEFFATSLDAHLLLGNLPEDTSDCDTADGRPATKAFAHARIARMIGGDATTVGQAETLELAGMAADTQSKLLQSALMRQEYRVTNLSKELTGQRWWAITSGSGEFLARRAVESSHGVQLQWLNYDDVLSLTDRLGPGVSECAPAFAVATLAKEKPL
jgi:probable H4MPT-linked C1 transfer pathway protein